MTDTPADVTTLTPAEAGAKLAELEAAYRAPPPSGTPQTAAEAKVRLEHLTSSREFAERFTKGDTAAMREFRELTEMLAKGSERLDFSEIETVDTVSNPGAIPKAHYEGLLAGLKEGGMIDSAEQYLRDLDTGVRTDRPTAGDGTACRQALDRLMKDPEFVRGALNGELKATKLRVALSNVIAMAADDGQPATEPVLKYLSVLGLR
jgi:hypothetical protein